MPDRRPASQGLKMAGSAPEIVSPEQAGTQLEIPASVTDEDTQVMDLIAEAADRTANKTGCR